MAATDARIRNGLLDRLPVEDGERIRAYSESVGLSRGDELYGQDGDVTHVYFPVSAVCSLVVRMADGKVAEAATVGNEGMLGIPVYLSVSYSLHTATTQVAGAALRTPVSAFLACVRQSASTERLVRRYIAYCWRSANQTVACNALHSVEERVCRWLLMTHDRVGDGEFELTHESLAEVLGTHRQTVSVVAGMLQRAHLIQYRRGVVRILNRKLLEDASCECYAARTQLYDDLMQND